ncbi:MAG: PilZ domain-containing protein [Deltaproteobacteria bacterium]|nr:PilZ domain-containing protein [Deltaproteobacteria bacterium]
MEATDMRAHPRMPVCCSADIFHTGANEPERGFVTDLSEGGAFVQTKRPLRRGDRLFLRVALDTEEVAGVATEVTWVKKFEPISVDGKLPGVGVRFLDLAPTDRTRIRGFLKDQQRCEDNRSEPPSAPAIDDRALLDSPDLELSEPKVIWHDTDVDEYDVAATDPPEGQEQPAPLDLDEPELGDPVLEDDLMLSLPPQRARRSPTVYFALGSLSLGIIAGALYGALAPAPPAVPAGKRVARPPAAATRIDLTAATAAPVATAAPAAETTTPAPAAAGPTLGDDDEIPGVTATKPTVELTIESSAEASGEPAALAEAPPAVVEKLPALEPIATAEPEPAAAKPDPAPAAAPIAVADKAKAASAASAASDSRSAISVSRPKQLRHGWQIAVLGGAKATKMFALSSPARAVIDLPAALATGLEARDLGAGPFERLRLGKQGDQTRLVFDLRGVVSTSQIKFSQKGRDLVIEVPSQALAHR